MEKCIYCGKEPHLVEITGLFYVQCGCARQNPYEYVGTRKKTAIEAWNNANNINAKTISVRCAELKKLRNPYIWMVDGKQYESYRDVLAVVKCSYGTMRKQFLPRKINNMVINGHIIVRMQKEV